MVNYAFNSTKSLVNSIRHLPATNINTREKYFQDLFKKTDDQLKTLVFSRI